MLHAHMMIVNILYTYTIVDCIINCTQSTTVLLPIVHYQVCYTVKGTSCAKNPFPWLYRFQALIKSAGTFPNVKRDNCEMIE